MARFFMYLFQSLVAGYSLDCTRSNFISSLLCLVKPQVLNSSQLRAVQAPDQKICEPSKEART